VQHEQALAVLLSSARDLSILRGNGGLYVVCKGPGNSEGKLHLQFLCKQVYVLASTACSIKTRFHQANTYSCLLFNKFTIRWPKIAGVSRL
jgi:hypothetical protein